MEQRLLILDDDPMIGETIQRIAEFAGLSVRHTTSADEFFQLLERWEPSHIALDLIMPDMDGVEVMLELAARHCRARIIVTSGVGSRVLDAAGRSAAEHGLDIVGVLSKPFSSVALRKMLLEPTEQQAPAQQPAPIPTQASEMPAITRNMLCEALEKAALYPVYQPKVDCETGQLTGFEALARWQHPTHGFIPPDLFIPLAEREGLIEELTDQIFNRALHWFATDFFQSRHPGVRQAVQAGPISLALNLSARLLVDAGLTEKLGRRCDALRVDPRQIILELTETSAMDDPIASLDLLTRMRMRGFQLSIDDFGTGYSSMLQLVRLPFSEIKIDKSFVFTAMQSGESRAVIRSIVSLGQSLGLRCTAEGVEDGETLAYLRKVGCDLAQGYFIGRPMAPSAIPDWISRYTRIIDNAPAST